MRMVRSGIGCASAQSAPGVPGTSLPAMYLPVPFSNTDLINSYVMRVFVLLVSEFSFCGGEGETGGQ